MFLAAVSSPAPLTQPYCVLARFDNPIELFNSWIFQCDYCLLRPTLIPAFHTVSPLCGCLLTDSDISILNFFKRVSCIQHWSGRHHLLFPLLRLPRRFMLILQCCHLRAIFQFSFGLLAPATLHPLYVSCAFYQCTRRALKQSVISIVSPRPFITDLLWCDCVHCPLMYVCNKFFYGWWVSRLWIIKICLTLLFYWHPPPLPCPLSPQELQSLERSNSALQKEIAALKKELNFYEKTLERHEPCCRLADSAASFGSSAGLLGSSSADCQTSSRCQTVAEASDSTSAASHPLACSLTSNSDLLSLDCIESTRVSPPSTTALASSAHPSAKLVTSSSSSSSSSPVAGPYSASFTTYAAPHSLFCSEPIMTSSPANVLPICDSLVSNPILSTAVQPTSEQNTIRETCYTVDGFLKKKISFLTASADDTPPYSQFEAGNTDCPNILPQLPPSQYSGNQSSSSTFLPLPLQNPVPPSLLASPPSGLDPSPAPSFGPKQSYDQDITSNPASLLSLLTVPGLLSICPATSSSFVSAPSQPPPSVPQSGDPSKDLSLHDLYDWILSGNNNQ